jgi:hypothetical protein
MNGVLYLDMIGNRKMTGKFRFKNFLKRRTCSTRSNVTLRRVRVTTVVMEKQQLLHIPADLSGRAV